MDETAPGTVRLSPQMYEALLLVSRRPRNTPGEPLPGRGSPGDAGPMDDNPQPTVTRAKCTCTGGPYVHGPEGLRQVLQEIESRQTLGSAYEGGPDHD